MRGRDGSVLSLKELAMNCNGLLILAQVIVGVEATSSSPPLWALSGRPSSRQWRPSPVREIVSVGLFFGKLLMETLKAPRR